MDLSPREVVEAAPSTVRRRKWGPLLVLALVLVAGGVVVTKFLTSAIDYFCNADEVGVVAKCSGDRRMRVLGKVDQDSIVKDDNGAVDHFSMTWQDRTITVDYSKGAPVPSLFQACIPVIVAGQMRGDVFEGTELEVKHSDEYQKSNSGRIAEAESAACAQAAG